MDPYVWCRNELLSALRSGMAKLRSEQQPGIAVKLLEPPAGDLAQQQRFGVGLECAIEIAAPDEPERLILSVVFLHQDAVLFIQSADVVWGPPSGHIEVSLFATPVECSDTNRQEIMKGLPRLLAAFQAGTRRAHPPD